MGLDGQVICWNGKEDTLATFYVLHGWEASNVLSSAIDAGD
jgi:hypothetical protein